MSGSTIGAWTSATSRAIDFKVATEGKGYTEEEAAQACRVLLTMQVSTEVHEYINSLPFDIQDDYDALKKALREQYTNQDDNLDALGMEISCLCQRLEESLRDYIKRTASMVSKCRGREELYKSLARAFHKGILSNTDRGPLGTAEWIWKLKGQELLLHCLDFMHKWGSSTSDFASAQAGEEEPIRCGIEEGRRKDKEIAELQEKVRREVEMGPRGSRDLVDLGYPYGSQPLQVSSVFQDQYPNYPDYRPLGDRQQFRPANLPNYREPYLPPVNRNPYYNCTRVGHRMHQEKNSASGRRGSVRAQQTLRTLRTQTGKVFGARTTHVSAQVAPNDTRHAICIPDAK